MGCRQHIAMILAIITALVLAMSGCAKGADADTSIPLGGETAVSMTLIGVSMGGTAAEGDAGALLSDTLQQAGYTVEMAYAEGSSETQANQINAILEDGASILLVQAVEAEAAEAALSRGDVADVTVIAVDTPLGGKNIDYFVGCDYAAMGRAQAERLVQRLKLDEGKERVSVELLTDAGADSAAAFAGAMEVLEPYMERGVVTILTGRQTAEDCAGDAAEMVRGLLAQEYKKAELNGLLCLGSGQAQQAIEVLKTDYRGASFPVVTGSGWHADYETLLRQHLLELVTVDPGADTGAQALSLVQTLLSGGEITAEDYMVQPVAVDRDALGTLLVEGQLVLPVESSGNAD